MKTDDQFNQVALEYDFVSEIFNNNEFFLKNIPNSKRRAIDIGCGSGILVECLRNEFEEVIGIDISSEMLNIAKSKRQFDNVTYISMNAENLSLKGRFDYIVSRTTLHHIEDKEALLTKLKDYLAPKGKIVILDNVSEVETPNRIVYTSGAVIELVPNVMKFGLSKAIRIFRHSTSESWLSHLAADKYLSEDNTRKLYEKNFPNCYIERINCFVGVVWENNLD